jgi:hypothetical protein
MCALVAFGGLAMSTFADVQNIRISGDIRIRGYFLSDVSGTLPFPAITGGGQQAETADSFITQRTRVTVEADLEDHVLVVVTLRAESMWGSANESLEGSAGAGMGQLPIGILKVNRGFDVGINEAYVQFNEAFWSPMTLKLGRQYLQYGRGLIFSSLDQEYNFDAARLIMDFYPLTVDLVYIKSWEGQFFGAGNYGFGTLASIVTNSDTTSIDTVFVNARYEMSDSVLRDVEAYLGYMHNHTVLVGFPMGFPWIPASGPIGVGASPVIFGLRADLAPAKNFDMWGEAAYEWGHFDGTHLDAWLANLGFRYTANTKGKFAINGNYVYASGGPKPRDTFVPWFDYNYFGYVLNPALANIHIFNLGISGKPSANTSLGLQAYYYLKADRNFSVTSNRNVDFGGFGVVAPGGNGEELGFEFDGIAGYDYSKDVRLQLVYGVFLPGHGFEGLGNSPAQLIRGEVNVRF